MSKDALTPAIAVLVDSFKPEDFVIDCEGCTACCRGHDGVKLDDGERHLYPHRHQDDKGEWRINQKDDACVYLDGKGCTIHDSRQPAHHHAKIDGRKSVVLDEPTPLMPMPRRCQEFDCRAAVIFFGSIGIDELVREAKLPLDVVTMGRKKLAEFNSTMNVRAVMGGGDLSFLMEDNPDATP